jgi:hypothetical protein
MAIVFLSFSVSTFFSVSTIIISFFGSSLVCFLISIDHVFCALKLNSAANDTVINFFTHDVLWVCVFSVSIFLGLVCANVFSISFS